MRLTLLCHAIQTARKSYATVKVCLFGVLPMVTLYQFSRLSRRRRLPVDAESSDCASCFKQGMCSVDQIPTEILPFVGRLAIFRLTFCKEAFATSPDKSEAGNPGVSLALAIEESPLDWIRLKIRKE